MKSARDDRAGDKVGKLASPRSFRCQIAVGVVGHQACARRQARAIEPAIRYGLDDRESVEIARGAGRVQRITADQPVNADCRRAETAGDRRSPAGRIDEKSYLDRLRLALRGDNSLPKSRPVSTLKSQRSRPRATVASIRSLAMPAERFSGTTYNSVITPNDPAA
jgi:hypothetical protein